MTSRRAVVLGGAALLGGCGFHPLYLPQGGNRPVSADLAAVYVPVIPERQGQLMRQALQRRMQGTGAGVVARYELIVAPAISAEPIAIQSDSSTSRFRVNGNATWTLRRLDVARTVVNTGSSRITDGYNIINQQYFAADLENSAAINRITETLADQIVTDVAITLKRQAARPPA